MNTSLFGVLVGLVGLPLLSRSAMAAPSAAPQVPAPVLADGLRAVSPAELPARAAEMVSRASAETRLAVAGEVVRQVGLVNPAIVQIVVGAIARVAPEAADPAAIAAVSIRPRELELFARTAAAAAPAQALGIVSAFCKEQPENFDVAAIAVAKAAPGQDEKILQAISVALPSLKFAMDRAYAEVSRNSQKISVKKIASKAKSYTVWDAARNEFSDASGIYRNSIVIGSGTQVSPGGAPAASSVGATVAPSALSGAPSGPQPATVGGHQWFFSTKPPITPVGSIPATPGPRDYSAP